jgi:uncharacterized membrane protein (DUF2068 family)
VSHEAHPSPGVARPERFLPRFHYELIVCGLRGHELVGTDAAELRDSDALFAREIDGVRWHRCLRCDSWLPFPRPTNPALRHPPERDEIRLPLRGRPLRDRIVLRVIAVDRAVHFVVLMLIAVAIFLLAANRAELQGVFYRVIADFEGGVGTQLHLPEHGLLHTFDQLLSLRSGTLRLVGVGAAVYGLIEGVEAVGLWYQRRWAEYLTLVATSLFIPLEVYELTRSLSPIKAMALIVNIAIVVYLLFAKRLFGLRGGAEAEERARLRDVGWGSLARTAPEAIAPKTPRG